jgi:hypothetical protein
MRMKRVKRDKAFLQKIHEEFAKFDTTMQELYLLKLVADDLKSYRKMIKLKRYD